MTRFYPYPFFNDSCFVVLPVGRPLWREDESVTYSAIADWPGHWGPITIHYRLIWGCVPSWSPLTTRRDYGGGIVTVLWLCTARDVDQSYGSEVKWDRIHAAQIWALLGFGSLPGGYVQYSTEPVTSVFMVEDIMKMDARCFLDIPDYTESHLRQE
jgi:hypothetical protein